MKRIGIAFAIGVLAVASAAVELTWNPPRPADKVQATFLQVMDLPSSNITTFATNGPSIVIPGTASNRLFRVAHSNEVGLANWTAWVSVPEQASGIKVIVPLVP